MVRAEVLLTADHFQVARTFLPESLERPALAPTGWPGRLLTSRSTPSPWASSSSYLEQITWRSCSGAAMTEWPLGLLRNKRVTGKSYLAPDSGHPLPSPAHEGVHWTLRRAAEAVRETQGHCHLGQSTHLRLMPC